MMQIPYAKYKIRMFKNCLSNCVTSEVLTDRQTDRQTDGRTDRQTDIQTEKVIPLKLQHFQCRALITPDILIQSYSPCAWHFLSYFPWMKCHSNSISCIEALVHVILGVTTSDHVESWCELMAVVVRAGTAATQNDWKCMIRYVTSTTGTSVTW